jgi:hypothetical protein
MKNGLQSQELNCGSCWHRWEPHIHAPGTVLNDQFRGADSWDGYLTALENTTPPIRAIGITDYYSTETYERICKTKRQGRLPGCELIFPNVEMRLGIGTIKGRWVNIHLLVSPEDPNHLIELRRFLTRLTFDAYGDTFSCNRDDLIRLGHWSDPGLTDPMIELQRGTEQFKVSLDQLKRVYSGSDWARDNILIAVAGSETDGTSGVRDAADATLRQEIEKFAHVIFAGSSAQREFWLGQRSATPEELRQRYGGLKPCMHGSDAHEQRSVGRPDADRYSWIKGAVEFDALRQACIDPVGRAYVGSEPPLSVMPSQIISLVTIGGADWAATPEIPLNSGLIAIIGARGSGKTALAEAVAAGCDAISSAAWNADDNITPSFLARARNLPRERKRDTCLG